MLPFAIRSGLTPLAAAMAMNLFGHGIALSYDLVIQGAPAVSASAAGISASQILTEGRPVFWVMGLTTVFTAFFLNRKNMKVTPEATGFFCIFRPRPPLSSRQNIGLCSSNSLSCRYFYHADF